MGFEDLVDIVASDPSLRISFPRARATLLAASVGPERRAHRRNLSQGSQPHGTSLFVNMGGGRQIGCYFGEDKEFPLWSG